MRYSERMSKVDRKRILILDYCKALPEARCEGRHCRKNPMTITGFLLRNKSIYYSCSLCGGVLPKKVPDSVNVGKLLRQHSKMVPLKG